MPEILLVGAGLTNLCLAYELERNGFFDYQIIEADCRPGGLLKTCRSKNFLFDQTGHFLHVSDPAFKDFLGQTVGLENFNILGRRSYVYTNGLYLAYPIQKNLYGLPEEIIKACLEGFSGRPHIKCPKTFHSWVLANFGRGLLDLFFAPYNKKLFCRSIKSVSASWTGRFVPDTTLADLERGARAKVQVDASGYNGCFFYPKDGGIELLISAIVKNLKNPILCNSSLAKIDLTSRKAVLADGRSVDFKSLVSSIPLPKILLAMPTGGAADWIGAAGKLVSTSVLCLNFGFDLPDLSEKHWIYFPEQKFPFYRAGFWHNFNAVNCPAGTSGVYTEVSTMEKSSKKREILFKHAKSALFKFLQIDRKKLITEHTQTLENAYVIFNQFREKNLNFILSGLRERNIESIGRFGAWKYSSMQESFQDGVGVARRLLTEMGLEKPFITKQKTK